MPDIWRQVGLIDYGGAASSAAFRLAPPAGKRQKTASRQSAQRACYMPQLIFSLLHISSVPNVRYLTVFTVGVQYGKGSRGSDHFPRSQGGRSHLQVPRPLFNKSPRTPASLVSVTCAKLPCRLVFSYMFVCLGPSASAVHTVPGHVVGKFVA